VPAVWEWVAQCYGADTGLTAQCRTVAAMASRGGTVPGYDSQAALEGRHGGDSPLTQAPAACQSIQCSGQGSGRGVTSLWRWTHASLERGGVPPEGASSPRARRSHARGVSSPRARRSFGVTAPGPSSEAEFCSRGVGAGCLLGRWCHPGRSCVRGSLPLVNSFAFLLFCEEMGSFPGY
jgi:hypothetical protein